jgi:hypothetical protein
VPGTAGSEDMSGAERHPRMVEEYASRTGQVGHHGQTFGHVVVESECAAIQPGKVGALRRCERHLRKVLGDEFSEQGSVRGQALQQRIEPVGAGPERRSVRNDADMTGSVTDLFGHPAKIVG